MGRVFETPGVDRDNAIGHVEHEEKMIKGWIIIAPEAVFLVKLGTSWERARS